MAPDHPRLPRAIEAPTKEALMPRLSLRSFVLVALLFLFAASATAPAAATCNIAPPGMTAWFPLDTMSSGTAENLRSGPDGTAVNGPVLIPGKVLSGWEFDGSNEYVQVANHSTLDFGTGDFSISAWIKTTELWGIIVAKRQPIGNYRGYQFLVAHGQLLLQIADSTLGWKNYHSSNTPTVNDGAWHQVTATVDRDSASGVRLYIDGQLIITFDPRDRQGTISNTAELSIGRANDAPYSPFDGVLDEVQLYNRALTASEVAGLYAPGADGQCKTPVPSLWASLFCGVYFSGSQSLHCTVNASGGVPPYSYDWTYWGDATFWNSFGDQANAYYQFSPYCSPSSWNNFRVRVTDAVGQSVIDWSYPYCI